MCFVCNFDVTILLQGYDTLVVKRNTKAYVFRPSARRVAEKDVFFLGGGRYNPPLCFHRFVP